MKQKINAFAVRTDRHAVERRVVIWILQMVRKHWKYHFQTECASVDVPNTNKTALVYHNNLFLGVN